LPECMAAVLFECQNGNSAVIDVQIETSQNSHLHLLDQQLIQPASCNVGTLLGAPMSSTVTLSSKNQVVIPQEARKKLGVGPGARLLVLVKEDRIVFMPEPRHFVKRFSGRHKGVWGKGYLERERRAWRR